MPLFTEELIQLADQENLSWQAAINLSAKPLIDCKFIEPEYVEDILNICQDKGPYMNIGKHVVLAHARPRSSTKKPVISLLITKKEVDLLTPEHPARLWFLLATPDDTSHIDLLRQLSAILLDADKINRLMSARDKKEVLAVVNG